MNILLIHNRYRQSGGEDSVFEAEGRLLEANGHHVARLTVDNHEISEQRSLVESLRLARDTIWSRQGAARVTQAIRAYKPEVAHFHNTFPLISPSAYSACHREGVAVVQTLHNYRLFCPNGTFFRNGKPCEDCLKHKTAWPGVVHGCYRGSRCQSAVVSAMLNFNRVRRTWNNDVDLYLAPSDFARTKFIAGGLPAEKIVIKPNFVSGDPGVKTVDGEYCLYVGRLTADKGLAFLFRAWIEQAIPMPLHIVGDGPLADEVRHAASVCDRVRYMGRLQHEGVLDQMKSARALIFPSLLYETFGLSALEAMACGLVTIASNHGATANLIVDGQSGLLFLPGDAVDLAGKVNWVIDHPLQVRQLAVHARAVYETHFTSEQNHRLLMTVYSRAIDLVKVSNASTECEDSEASTMVSSSNIAGDV